MRRGQLCGPLDSPDRRPGEPHPGLQPLEIRPSLLIKRDDLAVEDRWRPPERATHISQLRVRRGDDLAGPGAHLDRAVSRQIHDRPLAVLLGLHRPPIVATGQRQPTRCREHGRDPGQRGHGRTLHRPQHQTHAGGRDFHRMQSRRTATRPTAAQGSVDTWLCQLLGALVHFLWARTQGDY